MHFFVFFGSFVFLRGKASRRGRIRTQGSLVSREAP